MKKLFENPYQIFKKNGHTKRKKRLIISRLSPFLFLTIFLFCSFFYMIAAKTGTPTKIIALPFLVANIIFTDFALWNYFEGRKKGIIWALEGLVSTVILYWII